jgi:hypothetical protein
MKPLTKNEARVATFIHRALSTDEARPILMDVFVVPEYVCAADGWRIHAVPREAFPEAEDKTDKTCWRPSNKPSAGGFYALLEDPETDGHYPNIEEIIPNEIAFEIAVSPKLLVDALRDLGDYAVLRFTARKNKDGGIEPSDTSPLEITGHIKQVDGEDVPAYALLMPMYKDADGAGGYFKPRKVEKVAVECEDRAEEN